MSTSDQHLLEVEPLISYPHEAQVGKSYLMTIDLRLVTLPETWLYDDEEYPVWCHLDTMPLFSHKPLSEGERAVVLHRFGGTYGPAKFLLTAAREAMRGTIHITLMNKWGSPIDYIPIEAEIKHDNVLGPVEDSGPDRRRVVAEALGTTGMAEARNRFGVLKAHMMTLFDGTGRTIFPRLNTSRYTGAGYAGRRTPDNMASLILLDDDGGGVPSFFSDTTEMAVNQIEFPKMLWTEVVGKMQAGEVVEVTGEGQHIDWQGTYESGFGLVGVDTTPKPVHIKIRLSVSDDSRTLHLGFYKRNSDAQTDEPWIEYLNVTGSFE